MTLWTITNSRQFLSVGPMANTPQDIRSALASNCPIFTDRAEATVSCDAIVAASAGRYSRGVDIQEETR
jgi:hypothetical protein